jgi:hypothetical protein
VLGGAATSLSPPFGRMETQCISPAAVSAPVVPHICVLSENLRLGQLSRPDCTCAGRRSRAAFPPHRDARYVIASYLRTLMLASRINGLSHQCSGCR